MNQQTFYAIYDLNTKKFKGRSNDGWTDIPTQTYSTEGRANGALKASKKIYDRFTWGPKRAMIVVPVTVSWPDVSGDG